jgi:hypothetical protein
MVRLDACIAAKRKTFLKVTILAEWQLMNGHSAAEAAGKKTFYG